MQLEMSLKDYSKQLRTVWEFDLQLAGIPAPLASCDITAEFYTHVEGISPKMQQVFSKAQSISQSGTLSKLNLFEWKKSKLIGKPIVNFSQSPSEKSLKVRMIHTESDLEIPVLVRIMFSDPRKQYLTSENQNLVEEFVLETSELQLKGKQNSQVLDVFGKPAKSLKCAFQDFSTRRKTTENRQGIRLQRF